jgi:FixJ family two-component response regulator
MMSRPHFQGPSPIVYLVDDDPNDVLIIRRICESVGLVVRGYRSPQRFLNELSPEDHGCIVADLLMPEMTGLQLHAELQKKQSDLPIIVVTGHADASTCRTALHGGVFDFVEKSFNPHDLLVVIRAAIDKDASQKKERSIRNTHLEQLGMLSRREGEVMHLLAEGRTLKEIAAEFGISVQTASKHRSNLFEKLRVSNEVELLKLLIRIDPSHALPDPTVAA